MSHHPHDHHRPPREKMYEKETEELIQFIRERGDQRIGQLLINAVRKDIEWEEPADDKESLEEIERIRTRNKAKVEQKLWSIEAAQLLEELKSLSKQNSQGEE